MKNRLKIAFIICLSFMLASCNLASTSSSSSSSSSSSTTLSSSSSSSSSSTSTSTDINATITISAGDSSLTQYVGLTQKVTVTATTTNIASVTAIDWYVNNDRSASQTGKIFEFTPQNAESYNIQAKVGNAISNVITVSVDYPSFSVASINAIDSDTLEVIADPGISFAVTGSAISDTSYYNIASKTYVIDLKTKMVQGASYVFTMSKNGYKDLVREYLYDTRKLEVSEVRYDSQKVTLSSEGYYSITRPFSTEMKEYEIKLSQKNWDGTSYLITTNAPVGASSNVCPSSDSDCQNSIEEDTFSIKYSVTKNTVAGLYSHNILVNSRTILSIKIMIVIPTPYVTLDSPVVYGAAGTKNENGTYEYNSGIFSTDASGNYVNEVTKQSDGSYIVYRPYNGNAKQISFEIAGDYYSLPAGTSSLTPNNLLFALSGPRGGAMFYGNGIANSIPSVYPYGQYFSYVLTQYVDSTTDLGTYNYTFSAGMYTGTMVSKTITVIVREYSPQLDVAVNYGGSVLTPQSDGTYLFEKPLAGQTLTATIDLKVSNYESPLQYYPTEGASVLYDPDTESSSNALKYLLDYSVSYSGSLSGIATVNKKYAIELGAVSASSDTVSTVGQSTTTTHTRYKATGAQATIPIISDMPNIASIDSTSYPTTHVYTIRLGNLSKQIVIRVAQATPAIKVDDTSIKYGSGAPSADNVTYNLTDGKYYVDGKNGTLQINIKPSGMAAGSYSFAFYKNTPSGNVESRVSNSLFELNDPYDGTLALPTSGDGEILKVDEVLIEEGEYTYRFIINGISKTITIVVLPAPQLVVESAKIGENELFEFNNQYYVLDSTSSTPRSIDLYIKLVNVDSSYKYVLSSSSSGIGTKEDIEAVNGYFYDDISLSGNLATSGPYQLEYYLVLFDGDTIVGTVTTITINVQTPAS